MQAFGMLLLAAATVGDGFGYGNPGVGGKKWLRHDLVSTTSATAPPPTRRPRWPRPAEWAPAMDGGSP